MQTQLTQIIKIWPKMENLLSVPNTQKDYKRLVLLLDSLIDEVAEDEGHPLASLVETLGCLVSIYEDAKVPEKMGTAVEALQFLMNEHDLTQSDFPEIGSQGVVSEILAGHRKLNLRQIKELSKKFHVSPAVFVS